MTEGDVSILLDELDRKALSSFVRKNRVVDDEAKILLP